MPSEQHGAGSPAAWIRYAKSDLNLAGVARPSGVLLELLCFHAQQAAEKALKAVLVAWMIPVPHTHNIGTLLDLLPDEVNIPADIQDARILTAYAVMGRYPSDVEPVEQDEYEEAIRLAQAVVSWAEQIIKR